MILVVGWRSSGFGMLCEDWCAVHSLVSWTPRKHRMVIMALDVEDDSMIDIEVRKCFTKKSWAPIQGYLRWHRTRNFKQYLKGKSLIIHDTFVSSLIPPQICPMWWPLIFQSIFQPTFRTELHAKIWPDKRELKWNHKKYTPQKFNIDTKNCHIQKDHFGYPCWLSGV